MNDTKKKIFFVEDLASKHANGAKGKFHIEHFSLKKNNNNNIEHFNFKPLRKNNPTFPLLFREQLSMNLYNG